MLRNTVSILIVLVCLNLLSAEEQESNFGLPTTVTSTGNRSSLHNGGNTSTALQRLPLHWSEEEGLKWQVQLPGYGQSAPVIWDGRVYVTAIDGDNKEACLPKCQARDDDDDVTMT